MGEVYAHGFLNIAATASKNGHGGLFHKETRTSQMACHIELDGRERGSLSAITQDGEIWDKMIETSENAPIADRGWVMQERALSPRVVHFARDQVYWECCCRVTSEFSPSQLNKNYTLKGLNNVSRVENPDEKVRLGIYESWVAIVIQYSRCQLTEKLDKLPAFSGLTRRCCKLNS
jgi:hypothetical protein